MRKSKEEKQRQIQFYLDEAIRNAIDFLKVRVNEELSYDIGVEQDYYELLDKFEKHLELIKQVSKNLRR